MLTKQEYQTFSQHVLEAEALADRLSEANQPAAAADVMALRQSLRACITRAVTASTLLKETDEVLEAALKGAR